MAAILELAWRDPQYAALVNRHRRGMLYQDPFWLEMLEATLGHRPQIMGLRKNGHLRAALPYVVCPNDTYGPVINSLPFFGSMGGLVADLLEKKAPEYPTARVWLQMLIAALIEKAQALRTVALNIICMPGDALESAYRALLQPDFEDRRTTYIFDHRSLCTNKGQAYLDRFAGRTRTALRKAMKQPFDVAATSRIEDFDAFYRTHRSNMSAMDGTPKPQRFYDAICARRHDPRVALWVARQKGQFVSGALFFLYRHTVEYYMTALSPAYRSYQPQSLIIYTAMRHFAQNGFTHFNFGGTWPGQEGLQRFKAGWGTVAVPYRYLIKTWPGIESILAMTPAAIARQYPFFYVVPFDRLGRPQSHDTR